MTDPTYDTAALDDEMCTWPSESLLFTRANAADQWPLPLTPLTQDLVLAGHERGLALAWDRELGLLADPGPWTMAGCFYGYVYVGIDYLARAADRIPGWSAETVFEQYLALPRDPDAPPRSRPRPNPVVLARLAVNTVRASRRYPRTAQRLREISRRRWDEARRRDWGTASDEELAAILRESAAEWPEWRLPLYLSAVLAGTGVERLKKLTARFAGDEDGSLATAAISGLGGIDLVDTASLAAEVAAGRRTIDDVVERYGYRGPNEYELAARTWADDRSMLERLVQSAQWRERSVDRGVAIAEIRRRVGPLRWPVVRFTLRDLERHLRWRENSKVHEVLHVARQRLVVREAGRRMVDKGVVADHDDVFFLRAGELLGALSSRRPGSLRDAVDRRRRGHEAAASLQLPEIVEALPGSVGPVSEARIRALGLVPRPAGEPADRRRMVGEGVSPGRARGRVKVVTDPYSDVVEPGEILVAHTTDPAWTPLFATAAAVVVDYGGVLSHGAMLSRELGIPCVVNLKDASRRLATGDLVIVDGSTGEVVVEQT